MQHVGGHQHDQVFLAVLPTAPGQNRNPETLNYERMHTGVEASEPIGFLLWVPCRTHQRFYRVCFGYISRSYALMIRLLGLQLGHPIFFTYPLAASLSKAKVFMVTGALMQDVGFRQMDDTTT